MIPSAVFRIEAFCIRFPKKPKILAKTHWTDYNKIKRRKGEGGIFHIGFSELIVVLLIAFLVVGPKDLPRVARWLGRMVRKMRQLIREVKKETGWDELEKEFKDTKSDMDETIKDVKKDLDISSELKDAGKEWKASVKGVQDELKQAEAAGRESTGDVR